MAAIAQLRWNILMDSQEEYDCSLNSTIDWSTRGIARPFFGAFCIIFYFLTIPLYVLSANVIWSMRRASTYKVMFLLALADISTLTVNSFIFGIFLIMGEMYCHHPKLEFIYGFAVMFSFTLSCIACLILAINRMLELISLRLYSIIFKGSRTWYILFISISYPFFIASFTPLFFFNSEYHLVTVSPGFNEKRFEYYNIVHILNNTLMPTFSCIVYGFMILFIIIKKDNSTVDQSSWNRAAKLLYLQSGIIIGIHFTTCITYEVTQFIPPTEGILYIAQISWQLEHGLPPFIYMAFNQSLRNGVKQRVAPIGSSVLRLRSSIAPSNRKLIPPSSNASSRF